MNQANTNTVSTQCEETKLLGAHVSEEIYWAFKNAAAQRKETMATAIAHAARMYIETKGEEL